MKFKSIIILSLIYLIRSQDPSSEVVEPNDDETIQSPSKEAVIQHPVTVNVGPPQPMTTPPPVAPLKTRVVVVHNNMVPVPIECFQPPDSGTCSKDLARIYYDHETRTCKPFSYTGCGGNANRFQSIKNCYRICHPYRYKIRPKVASKKMEGPQGQAMKVRIVPAKQEANYGSMQNTFPQTGQMVSPQSRMINQQQQRQRPPYGGPSGYPRSGGYGQQPGYPQAFGSQPGFGRELTPMTQQHVVMTPNGPKVKNQPVGQGSGVPANTGSMDNYRSGK